MTIKVDNATLAFKDQEGNIAVLRSLSTDDIQSIKDVISQSNTNKGAISDLELRVDSLENIAASNAVTVAAQTFSLSQQSQARANIAAASETTLDQHINSSTAHYELFAEKAPLTHLDDTDAHKSLFELKASNSAFEAHLTDDVAHDNLFSLKQDKSDMVNYVTVANEQEISGVKSLPGGIKSTGMMAYAGTPRVVINANSNSLVESSDATLTLRGSTDTTVVGQSGAYVLTAGPAGDRHSLVGASDGSLVFDGKHVVRSINGKVADANGNVKVSNSNVPSDTYEDLSQVASGTILTAPADGFFAIAGVTGYVRLDANFISSSDHSNDVSADVSCYIPVKSGDTVTVYYSLDAFSYLRFVYAEGAL